MLYYNTKPYFILKSFSNAKLPVDGINRCFFFFFFFCFFFSFPRRWPFDKLAEDEDADEDDPSWLWYKICECRGSFRSHHADLPLKFTDPSWCTVEAFEISVLRERPSLLFDPLPACDTDPVLDLWPLCIRLPPPPNPGDCTAELLPKSTPGSALSALPPMSKPCGGRPD